MLTEQFVQVDSLALISLTLHTPVMEVHEHQHAAGCDTAHTHDHALCHCCHALPGGFSPLIFIPCALWDFLAPQPSLQWEHQVEVMGGRKSVD